jgi:hypothetical protein
MDDSIKGPVPLFVTVTCCAPLVVPVARSPKERDVGERLAADAPALPNNGIVCDGILPPKLTVSVPVRAPVGVWR